MKICMISNAFSLEKTTPPRKIGGAETCVERIAKALSFKGHKLVIITQAPFAGLCSLLPRKKTIEGLTIYSFYPLNIFSIYHTHRKTLLAKGIWRLLDLINPLSAILVYLIVGKEKPDIIHNHILYGFSPLFLLRLLKITRIPLIQTLHSYGFLCLRCNLLRHTRHVCLNMPWACRLLVKISRVLVNSAPDIVISPSQFCLNIYGHYQFFKKSKKIVLANGVETYTHNPHQEKKDRQEEFRVLYAGRLVPEKGVEVLIRAFKKIASLKIRLTIVGEGALESYLKRLVQNDNRIQFLGKFSWERLKELYKSSDITVVPSVYYEILGNVVLESMAHGTGVIASNIGGIPELIQNGQNGYLFKAGDVDGLRAILEKLINNPAQVAAIGDNAFKTARRYQLNRHIETLEKLYAQTISNKYRNQTPPLYK